jgi:hypothetical protein
LNFPIAFVIGVAITASEWVDFFDDIAEGIGSLIAGAVVWIDDLNPVDFILVAVSSGFTEGIGFGSYAVYSIVLSG